MTTFIQTFGVAFASFLFPPTISSLFLFYFIHYLFFLTYRNRQTLIKQNGIQQSSSKSPHSRHRVRPRRGRLLESSLRPAIRLRGRYLLFHPPIRRPSKGGFFDLEAVHNLQLRLLPPRHQPLYSRLRIRRESLR